jgi:hypothetical protein
MRRLTAALGLLIVFAVFGSASAPAATSAGAKHCQNVVLRNPDGTVYTRTKGLSQRNSSCPEARKVARAFLHGSEGADSPPRPYGFRCSRGADGVSCRKGRKVVTWSWYRD